MARRRVVITGIGAVTPVGLTIDRYWESLVTGRSGIATVTRFDPSDFDAKIGGECADFDASNYLDRKVAKRLDRFAQFALVASDEAVKASGLNLDEEDRWRIGVVLGCGIGGLSELEEQHSRLESRGPAKVSPFTIPRLMANAASGNVSIAVGTKGPSLTVTSACASATNAMGEAANLLRHGVVDVVLTGGAEAALTPLALAAFASMKALSTQNDDPPRACRPFDRDRDGFVLSEGAGTLVFEEYEHAKRRGAPILAEFIGYGSTADADHITQPSETGEAASKAMELALADAEIAPDQVDYINAHGTGTPLGDKAESLAIKRVFGDAARKLVISSTKSSTGHALGASGAIELIATILAMKNGAVPPTINLDNPGEGCDLDYCPNTARDANIRIALSNSFGFGGHNACVLVKRMS